MPGYAADLWLNLAGPAGLPADIVQKLNAEIGKALQDKEVQANFRSAGVDPAVATPQETGNWIRTEYDKWGKVVRDTGATVN